MKKSELEYELGRLKKMVMDREVKISAANARAQGMEELVTCSAALIGAVLTRCGIDELTMAPDEVNAGIGKYLFTVDAEGNFVIKRV